MQKGIRVQRCVPGSLGLFPYRGIVPLWMVADCVGSGRGVRVPGSLVFGVRDG